MVDLEDAVPDAGKVVARDALADMFTNLDVGALPSIFLRVNGVGSAWCEDDLAAVVNLPVQGVALPKFEHVDEVSFVRSRIGSWSGEPRRLMVGIESVIGVADSRALLAAGPDIAYFGAEDYVADLGGRRTFGNSEVLMARSAVAVAARLSGVCAIDQAVVAINDDEAYTRESREGRSLGYEGKLCIHPSQVVLANAEFSESLDDIAAAERVVAALRDDGVSVIDGHMVDAVHVAIARRVLERALGQSDPSPQSPIESPLPTEQPL